MIVQSDAPPWRAWSVSMYQIVDKKILNPSVVQLWVKAPLVASKARPGQFIILRVGDDGERIPLTVAGVDTAMGTVKIIYQIVGATTEQLAHKDAGDYLADFVGPLGEATHLDGLKNVCIVGGGVGCAIALPIAEALHKAGARVTSVIGFRSRDLVILEEEFRACSDALVVMTDDGSYGERGNVTLPLGRMLSEGEEFDQIITIGPLIMMKYVVATARPHGTPVTVSMNPIMIDGTGMCGGCRLTLNVEGKKVTKFACVDGPDFNGYEVDFDEAMMRSRMYAPFERHAHEKTCNLYRKEVR
jgi:ferredoxin--NADP+ reductase